MVRLDSIKVSAPIDAILDYDNAHFVERLEMYNNELISKGITAQNIDFGINNFTINKVTDVLIFEVSAKALKNDYALGINDNTFEHLIDSINSTNVIKLDSSIIYNEGKLLRADVTDNVKFEEYFGTNFYTDITAIPLTPNKYDITSYSTLKNKGAVIKGKQKSFKERQIYYDKITELLSNKKGREFLNSINSDKVFKDFKDTIRVEGNFNQLRTMRKYLGTDNLISNSLQSDAKVNYELFKKITKTANTDILYLFDKYEGMNWKDIKERQGIEGIIKSADSNWQYIELLIKKYNTHNFRRERLKFKQVYNELQSDKVENKETDKTIITMFLDALYKVA
jgi:hypothetical protein